MGTTAADRLVLLVEDNESDADMYQMMLQELQANPYTEDQMETTTVEHESSLGGAMSVLQADGPSPDAILLDLNLPDSRGLKTLDAVLDATDSAAVVVLTGVGSGEMGSDAVARGAQDFLTKDHVTPRVLTKTISYAIERRRKLIELDRQRRQLAALSWLVRHDIRNDASVVLGWADGLDASGPAEKRALQHITDAGKNIVKSTESVGALLQSLDSETDNVEPVELMPIVEEEVAQLNTRHDNLSVSVSEPDQSPIVKADPFLGTVVRNSLESAIGGNSTESNHIELTIQSPNTDPATIEFEMSSPNYDAPEDIKTISDIDHVEELTDVGIQLFVIRTFLQKYGGTVTHDSKDEGSSMQIIFQRVKQS